MDAGLPPNDQFPLFITNLNERFASGQLDPQTFLLRLREQIAKQSPEGVWIHVCSEERVIEQLNRARERARQGISQPLLGVPFAVKDNIDFAGTPTTVACPAYAYTPTRSASVVQRLCDAGAIVMGKTNLDQFATGLVGTRSPYGVCRNPFDETYISGGSSSGSAVAVALGQVCFALGTDTAGSGRVPAAFNHIVGLKPTRGLISTRGVVPACQSLDCVSIFALHCADVQTVLSIADAFDAEDPYSRPALELPAQAGINLTKLRFGVLPADQREFFDDPNMPSLYAKSVETMKSAGHIAVEIDSSPFAEVAAMLYAGPWVAERYVVAGPLIESQPEALLPVTRSILSRGKGISAAQTFQAFYKLHELRQRAVKELTKVDVLLLPTAGTVFKIDPVLADPIATNDKLGRYTNFANLLDLCVLAVPAGFNRDGVPLGVSFAAMAGQDIDLLKVGDAFHRATQLGAGISKAPLPAPAKPNPSPAAGLVRVAVVGAHLSGMPLNWQLTDRDARLVRATRTAPVYQFFALPNTTPPKPGLVHTGGKPGHSIELEVWEMPVSHYGSFVALIGSPLGIGTVHLEDGSTVQGFVCESFAVSGATDISHFGGWRAYIASLRKS